MAFDFPNTPTVGQIYTSSTGVAYTWDGEKWTSGSGYGTVYISDSAPAAPVGSFWWQSSTGNLYIRYFDGNSTAWILAIPGGGAQINAVLYDRKQTLTPGQQSQARANIGSLKKNYIVNGAMRVSQENGQTAGTAIGQFYPVDQFVYDGAVAGGTISIGQVTSLTPAGSATRIRATVTVAHAVVAADGVIITTKLEGARVDDLLFGSAGAKTVTIQFGVRAPAGTYCVTIRGGSAYSYVSEYTISAAEANTDVLRSVTVPGPTTGTWVNITLSFGLAVGVNYQHAPNAWLSGDSLGSPNQFNFMGTVNNVFELFDVGMYEGTAAPPFQVPDYVSELALCQRYYFQQANPPGVAIGNGSGPILYDWNVVPPVSMRASPTVSISGRITFTSPTLALGALSLNSAAWGGTNNIVIHVNADATVAAGTYLTNGSAGILIFNARL